MSTLDEKRVYSERETPTPVYVAAEQGLVVARLSGDIVGEFSLAHRDPARDVAVGDALVVATDDAALVAADGDHGALRKTGFGPAVAVGILAPREPDESNGSAGSVVAAAADGRVARLPLADVPGADGTETAKNADPPALGARWETVGTVDDPRALDGGLVAAADGVYRIEGDGLTHSGLTTVNDVAATGVPLAATDEALYELGNGWMVVDEGAHEVVDSDGRSAHAVTFAGNVVARAGGGWGAIAVPTDERIVGFDYADGSVVAATAGGSLLVEAGDGWRSRALGVTDVRAVAIP